MKIALVTGHDISNQGAYGNMGISEFQFMDELLSEMSLGDYFPEDIEFGHFYRSADIHGYSNKMIDLHHRIDKWGADISIEFHFNSFSSDLVQGHEVLYCSSSGRGIANALNKCMDDRLNNLSRGIKKVSGSDRGAGFCCRGNSLAIIIEPFFGAHQHKFMHGKDQREQLKLSLKDFFNTL